MWSPHLLLYLWSISTNEKKFQKFFSFVLLLSVVDIALPFSESQIFLNFYDFLKIIKHELLHFPSS